MRENAIIDAHRLHRDACATATIDHHWAADALGACGWHDSHTRAVISKGSVARHHALYTLDDSAFGLLDTAAVRKIAHANRNSVKQVGINDTVGQSVTDGEAAAVLDAVAAGVVEIRDSMRLTFSTMPSMLLSVVQSAMNHATPVAVAQRNSRALLFDIYADSDGCSGRGLSDDGSPVGSAFDSCTSDVDDAGEVLDPAEATEPTVSPSMSVGSDFASCASDSDCAVELDPCEALDESPVLAWLHGGRSRCSSGCTRCCNRGLFTTSVACSPACSKTAYRPCCQSTCP
jgi:hypothetical protein